MRKTLIVQLEWDDCDGEYTFTLDDIKECLFCDSIIPAHIVNKVCLEVRDYGPGPNFY